MKQFVICRTDSVWGERALHQLIEIFLNPGDEIIGGEALVGAIDANESPNDLNANMDMTSVFTADKLIMVNLTVTTIKTTLATSTRT